MIRTVPQPPPQMPSWLAGVAVGSWFEIPNSALAGSNGVALPAMGSTGGKGSNDAADRINIWCGCGHRARDCRIVVGPGGGHGAYIGNELSSGSLLRYPPDWTLHRTYTPVADVSYDDGSPGSPSYNHPEADGRQRPSARHNYYSHIFIDMFDQLHMFGDGFLAGTEAQPGPKHNAFNLSGPNVNDWDVPGTWGDMNWDNKTSQFCKGPDEKVYTRPGSTYHLNVWTPQTDSWVSLPDWTPQVGINDNSPMVYDPAHGNIVLFESFGFGAITVSTINVTTGARTLITLTGTGAAAFNAGYVQSWGADWCADRNSILLYLGVAGLEGVCYEVTPNFGTTWDCSRYGTGTPGTTGVNGLMNRFGYMPLMHGFFMMPDYAQNVWFLRTA